MHQLGALQIINPRSLPAPALPVMDPRTLVKNRSQRFSCTTRSQLHQGQIFSSFNGSKETTKLRGFGNAPIHHVVDDFARDAVTQQRLVLVCFQQLQHRNSGVRSPGSAAVAADVGFNHNNCAAGHL